MITKHQRRYKCSIHKKKEKEKEIQMQLSKDKEYISPVALFIWTIYLQQSLYNIGLVIWAFIQLFRTVVQ
jgi:hypothetical protein